ncbi:3'-5' exonuclease [Clostridium sp. L74]|uniref:3'-5' exonuclease n=1 Tax=Clostridium sp. L74 TaxID=1560217 RepID=UPI0006ABD6ED|nr:3'-5' exonuclease [Clostridium sp. L74]KOR24224.1 hypothetical protein ND00_29300 [Clostridium sp. L74]
MDNNLLELQKVLGMYNKKCKIYLIVEWVSLFLMFFNIIFIIGVFIFLILYICNNMKRKNAKKKISEISLKEEIVEKVENKSDNIELENTDFEDINKMKNLNLYNKIEEELYLESFNDIPKYNLNKKLDAKFIKSITRSKEVEYDKFIKYPNTTKKPSDFVVLDFETTGLDPVNNEIVQIGAIKFENYKPVQIFSTYVKPNKRISKRITQINGITNEMVESYSNIEDALPNLLDFIGEDYIIAHNASFDISFLLENLYKYNFKKPKNKAIDTLKLARSKLREYDIERDREIKLKTYKLEELKYRFELGDLSLHDALSDCKVCAYIYINIIKQNGDTYCLY